MIVKIGIGVIVTALLTFFSWRAPRLASVTIWSLAASILLTAALLLLLPGEFSLKARWIALAVPIIWVGLQYWCYYDDSAKRVAGTLILLSVISGAIVVLSEPLV